MYVYIQQGGEKEVVWLEQMSYPEVPHPSYCVFDHRQHSNLHGYFLHCHAPESRFLRLQSHPDSLCILL